jgi:quercetin dioxygenase-like cupin family protein
MTIAAGTKLGPYEIQTAAGCRRHGENVSRPRHTAGAKVSLKAHAFAALVLSLTGIGVAQQAPVPMDEEPHHHVLLKNEFVEVIRATIPPGESTLFHTHSHDSAGFDLVKSTSTEQFLGKPEGAPSTSPAGEVWAESRPDEPYTHRVHNVGDGPVDVFDVEFLQRPKQPSGSAAAVVAAENASARVYMWALAPGATSEMHTHERPYLIVAATSMQLKMTAPDGKSFADRVRPGDFHLADSKVTHTLTNEGTAEGQIVEIELK